MTTFRPSDKLRKFIHPVLKGMGFERYKPWWRFQNDDDWLTQIDLRSPRYSDDLFYLEFGIGFYSRQLDECMGWRRTAGEKPENMPNGRHACHFEARINDLDESGVWQENNERVFISSDGTGDHLLQQIAVALPEILPLVFDRYANFESVIACKRDRIGRGALSKTNGLYAAAACVELGRYDEAREFLKEAIRPGSLPFMKQIGKNLLARIDAST